MEVDIKCIVMSSQHQSAGNVHVIIDAILLGSRFAFTVMIIELFGPIPPIPRPANIESGNGIEITADGAITWHGPALETYLNNPNMGIRELLDEIMGV